jgi:hypothetical protein
MPKTSLFVPHRCVICGSPYVHVIPQRAISMRTLETMVSLAKFKEAIHPTTRVLRFTPADPFYSSRPARDQLAVRPLPT